MCDQALEVWIGHCMGDFVGCERVGFDVDEPAICSKGLGDRVYTAHQHRSSDRPGGVHTQRLGLDTSDSSKLKHRDGAGRPSGKMAKEVDVYCNGEGAHFVSLVEAVSGE